MLKDCSLLISALKGTEPFYLCFIGFSSGLTRLRVKEKAFPRSVADVDVTELCQLLFR